MIQRFLVIVLGKHLTCKTDDSGNSKNTPCVFPFVDSVGGEVRKQCTTVGGYSKPWCPISIDEGGIASSLRGYCSPGCPGATECKKFVPFMYVLV